MTNDNFWLRGVKSIGNIGTNIKGLTDAINRQTILELANFAYKEGLMSRDDYMGTVSNVMKDCGYCFEE